MARHTFLAATLAGPHRRRGMLQCMGVAGGAALVLTGCLALPGTGADSAASTETGSCEGWARECYRLLDGPSCSRQEGCLWEYSRSERSWTCSGRQHTCATYSNEIGCVGQVGCSFRASDGRVSRMEEGMCVGSAVPCRDLDSQEACSSQRGLRAVACLWRDGRCGDNEEEFGAVSCGAFSSAGNPRVGEERCSDRWGCEWVASREAEPPPQPEPGGDQPGPGR